MPISIIDVPLPEQPDDLWHAYCELIRTNNHLLIDGPGWDATDEASLHRARANLAERTTERLLAVDRERPVGFASLSVQLVDDPDAPQVFVFVLPDERGRGIGGELAARLDERLAARGAKRATAWVEAPRPGDDRVVPTSGVGARRPTTTASASHSAVATSCIRSSGSAATTSPRLSSTPSPRATPRPPSRGRSMRRSPGRARHQRSSSPTSPCSRNG